MVYVIQWYIRGDRIKSRPTGQDPELIHGEPVTKTYSNKRAPGKPRDTLKRKVMKRVEGKEDGLNLKIPEIRRYLLGLLT